MTPILVILLVIESVILTAFLVWIVMAPVDDPDWEMIARRLFILGDYGFNTEHMIHQIDDPDFMSPEWFLKWYGHPLPEYMLKEMRVT